MLLVLIAWIVPILYTFLFISISFLYLFDLCFPPLTCPLPFPIFIPFYQFSFPSLRPIFYTFLLIPIYFLYLFTFISLHLPVLTPPDSCPSGDHCVRSDRVQATLCRWPWEVPVVDWRDWLGDGRLLHDHDSLRRHLQDHQSPRTSLLPSGVLEWSIFVMCFYSVCVQFWHIYT